MKVAWLRQCNGKQQQPKGHRNTASQHSGNPDTSPASAQRNAPLHSTLRGILESAILRLPVSGILVSWFCERQLRYELAS